MAYTMPMEMKTPIPGTKLRLHQRLGAHIADRPVGLLLVMAYKGVWGLVEVASGLFFFLSKGYLAAELGDDPQDQLANWIISNIEQYHIDTHMLGAIFIGIGLTKLLLAACLWFRFAAIREIGLAFFSLVGFYGLYRITVHFSYVTLFALFLDLCSLYYFWEYLPKHLTRKQLYE